MKDPQALNLMIATLRMMLMVLIGIPFNKARLRVERRMQRGFDQVGLRFEETKELWRSELRRVEEIRDARLKHLETK